MDNMGDFTSFVVNGKSYNIRRLGVFESLSYHIDFMSSMGGFIGSAVKLLSDKNKSLATLKAEDITAVLSQLKPDDTKRLMKFVLSRVITPEQMSLDNPVAVQEWFDRPENSGDLWGVLLQGVFILLGEHLPSSLNTAMLGIQKALAGLSSLTMPTEFTDSSVSR